jgi:predicted metal-binding membrane protein
MMYMRMPGQTWPGAAASFIAMWIVMMAAMMLPSLVPALRRCRHVRSAALACAGYFFVWAIAGIAVFPLGAALAAAEMRHPSLSRAVPAAIAVVVTIAGAVQFTAWKASRLACCRESHARHQGASANVGTGWRYGVGLGLQCVACCGNLMAILLVTGVMDAVGMAIVTAAITAERLAPAGQRVAHAIGVVAVGTGVMLMLN